MPNPDEDLHELEKAYRRARSDLKMANRDNRDQSLELRDLKKVNAIMSEKNATLREQNTQLRESIRARGEKITRSEKAKYLEHFELLESHISHLQHERQKRETHMESLTEQTQEANEAKSSLEAECRRLQRQIRDLSDNLTECKDDLLRLQPTSQVPDNEISEQYEDLDQRISGWIDDRTEDSQLLEEQFDKIMTSEDIPDLFKPYLTTDHIRMAKKYPGSQPTILRYLIHNVLDKFIFNDDIYLFALDVRNIGMLKGLEEGMKLLEPRRGA